MLSLQVAVDKTISILQTLRSIGVPVILPIRILGDNKAVIDSSTIAGSTLKKRWISIAYHCCRSSVAAGMIEIYHIDGKENPADFLTKSLPSEEFRKCIIIPMTGQDLSPVESTYEEE